MGPVHRTPSAPQEEVVTTAAVGTTDGLIADRWVVGPVLAHGGQATVHRAHHVSLGRTAAIKLFHPHVWADPAFRVRFRRECEALVALEHPNVIPVLDAGESEGTGWLVMHLAVGGSLADRLAAGPLHVDEAVAILRQVAAALDAAHTAGRLHRDVKPGNVLLEPDGHVWLADFGVARPVGTTTTVTGQLVGTAAYMAPEVIGGERARPPADVYAFACMAFEVLTGIRPFPDAEVGAVLFAHLERPAPRARSLRPDLPRSVDRVLAAGLAKDPRDRPRTATALVDGLVRALPGPGATVSLVPPIVPRRLRRQGRGRRAALAAGGVMLAGCTAGLALVMAASDDTPAAIAAERLLPTIPTAGGEMRGRAASPGAVPGTSLRDRVAVAHARDGLTLYAVEAGTSRTSDAVGHQITSALASSGLAVGPVDLQGGGMAVVAHGSADLLRFGATWAVARVPGATSSAPTRIVVARGDGGAPTRWADALSAARPGAVHTPS